MLKILNKMNNINKINVIAKLLIPNEINYKYSAEQIRNGKCVAFPTETVLYYYYY